MSPTSLKLSPFAKSAVLAFFHSEHVEVPALPFLLCTFQHFSFMVALSFTMDEKARFFICLQKPAATYNVFEQ